MARLGSFSVMPLQSPFRLSCRRARSSPSFAHRPRFPLPPPPRPNTRADADDVGWLKEGRHFCKHKNGLRKETNTMAIHQAGQIAETTSPGCLKIPTITNDAEPIESLVPQRTSKPMHSNDYNRYANLRELASGLDEQAERPNEKKDALKPEEHAENNNRSAREQGLEMLKEMQSADDIVLACSIEEVLIVNDVAVAKEVVRKLRGQYRDLIHACDTEVADIDVRKQSPVGHGRVTCFSIYCGPSADFGGGKTCVWVDSLDGGDGMFDIFKQYFEDNDIKKVWHNYSFDKHVLGNHEIKVAGFYADTVHLARLWNSGRKEFGYSLESLTSDPQVMDSVQFGGKTNVLKKTSMKELFAVKKINKNGSEGKIRIIPPVIELQRNENTRIRWVCYSAGDSVCTWMLWYSLKTKLERQDCFMNGTRKGSMHDFYLNYWRPFGNVLVDMETKGILVDREYLAALEITAIREQESATKLFRQWASKYCPDAQFMNVGSDLQVRQLLFGGFKSLRSNAELPKERVFQTPNVDGYIEEGSKRAKKTRPRVIRCVDVQIPVDHLTSSGFPQVTMLALKTMAGNVSLDLAAQDNDDIVGKQNPRKSNREDATVYGTAYDAFGGGTKGIEACNALAALCEVAAINTLISGFIQPLQGGDILGPYRRIHCSMNLNTETGRLSARRPNLQNQPALEKDRYQIRKAFVASPGNSLIVADYGQLELRVLAHLSNCKSMIQAFKMGGDFHSRTAMNMYDYVRKAVGSGDVILEWKQKAGEEKPSAPMLKDKYAAERRKAKMLNFSIAYGKTPMGLAKDWKVTVEEAKKTLELWYNDRSEVREWQEQRKYEALRNRCVYTLMGRPRHFPSIKGTKISRGHIERVAINSPVQGSAADVAMCAMLEIYRNARLRELGWELILQVHDEVILEGPSESAIEAKDLVVQCMCFPFNGRNILNVDLVVDAKCAQNWYEAK